MPAVIKQTLCILLFSAPTLMAQGGIFGLRFSPCLYGGVYDEKNHQCYYCAKGTQPIDESFLKTKKCTGTPVVGARCPQGSKAWFDRENKLCVYCEEGYTFSYQKACYQ